MSVIQHPIDPITRVPPPLQSDRALMGIYEISKILCGPGDLRQLLAASLNVLSSFLEMETGVIALLDENGDAETVVSVSMDRAGALAYFRALPERVVGQMVVTSMPVVVDDIARDTAFGVWDTTVWGTADAHRAFVGVPIGDRDRVVGILTIDREWVRQADLRLDDDMRFLKMAANLIGQTVRLHRMVMRDRERMLADQRRVEKEREDLARPNRPGAPRIIGESATLRAVMDQVRRVARSDAPILLRGESGTGKELFAEAIHQGSPRRDGPFIRLNCAALPESVLESELFGHEKGAFTGAVATRKGRFEMADNGTLFLDEIGEISGAFQAKLLRVLQEGEFERVGGTRTLKVNVRLVSATNRDLEDAVTKGVFRADLYYRIAVVPLFLPALRDRPGDIPMLAREFLDRFNRDNKTGLTFSTAALTTLQGCYFPGNVRELENCVRRTATMAQGDTVVDRDLSCRNDGCLSSVLWRNVPRPTKPTEMARAPASASPVSVAPGSVGLASAPPTSTWPAYVAPASVVGAPAVAEAPLSPAPFAPAPFAPAPFAPAPFAKEPLMGGRSDHDALLDAMERAGWVQAKAARLLNVTPRQIGYALRRHHIPIKKF